MDIKELKSFKLSDAVKFHDTLNPKLWRGQRLDRPVRNQLLTIAQDFVSFMGISDLAIEDITISGSNAAFSYTPHSDIDLHILVDFSKLPEDEVYKELFGAKKTLYNEKHDITVNKVPVELYVQDTNQVHTSLGEYSLLNDKWVKIPKKRRANLDQRATRAKYEKLGELVELALRSKDLEKVTDVLNIISRYRKAGLSKAGEFGPENLAFKAVRAQGLIQKLYDLRAKLHAEKLSTESMYEQKDKDHYLGRLAQAAQEQRGKPESAMNQAQLLLGGGVLDFVIEHVGDIYNRMYNTGYGLLDDPSAIEERRGVVLDKIKKTLRSLTNPYGFEREHKENMTASAKSRNISLDELQEKADTALQRYADAHKKLPVYNKLQRLARAASIALGEKKFNEAAVVLYKLKDIAEDPQLWAQEINKVSENIKEAELDEATRRGFLQGLGTLGISAISGDAEAGKYMDPIDRILDRKTGWEFWDKEQKKLEQRIPPILNKLMTLANQRQKDKGSIIGTPSLTVGKEPAIAAVNGNRISSKINIDVTVFYDLSDDAIAATLAHEIGHLALNHPDYGNNVKENRELEIKADIYGIKLMMAAGYNPKDALKSLEDQGLAYAETASKTHPAVSVRKRRINEALKMHIFHIISAIKNYKSNVQYVASLSQQGDTKLAESIHKRLKKEDYHPNAEPPGPEFKPTMPKGTVRVDVSDVYDWYKLGQHISNLKGLGKHDFGKGPPSTILSFGDEDTEHRYITDLEKTGLSTTDIDPPGGKKKQKVDPTYNVKEASGPIDEIGFADALANLSLPDREIIDNSTIAGTIGQKPVRIFTRGASTLYFFATATNILALVLLDGTYLKAIKNFTNEKGMIYSLLNYIVNLEGLRINIAPAEPFTAEGIKWLLRLTNNTHGLKLTKSDGHAVDIESLKREWNNAKLTKEPGKTGLTLSETSDGWKKKLSENENSLMPFRIFEYSEQLSEASGYIPSEKEKNDPRFKTALTIDVKPDTMKKDAAKLGNKISRAGIPPLLRHQMKRK